MTVMEAEIGTDVLDEAELAIVDKLASVASLDHWEIGKLATEWTRKWSRGRSDGDLARLVNERNPDADVSRQYVNYHRLVFEKFASCGLRDDKLSFQHHRVIVEEKVPEAEIPSWFFQCNEENLNAKDLRRAITRKKQGEGPPADQEDRTTSPTFGDIDPGPEPTAAGEYTPEEPREVEDDRTSSRNTDIVRPVQEIGEEFEDAITDYENAASNLPTDDAECRAYMRELVRLGKEVLKAVGDTVEGLEGLLADG